MKKVNFKKIILMAMCFCAVIASMAQSKEAKAAIEETKKIFEDIKFLDTDNLVSMDANFPEEQFGYLLPAPNELVVEDKGGLSFNPRKISFILPGAYTLSYRRITYAKGMTTGNQVTQGNVTVSTSYTQSNRIESKLTHVDAVFEAGKYYTTKYEVIRTKGIFNADSIAVSIAEVTDPKMVLQAQTGLKEERERKIKLNEFLQYQEQNPTRLEGMWSKKYKDAFIRFNFEGEKIRYRKAHGKSIDDNKNPVEAEGRLFYSENIIVVIPEKASFRGKETKNISTEPVIYYYTIINDELHIDKKIQNMLVHAPWFYPGALKRN